ncbi:hypothetical protein [Streptomyces sp. 142MFCol3.1]|uniref:hypothetical protein n=1 Tax=Streptomyces sp. 142MFCol3.1 TaxID=1172179 RepID=UPI000424B2BB|nr:hypothetical protein [Streptomyces sp. 142MFCol3.1]
MRLFPRPPHPLRRCARAREGTRARRCARLLVLLVVAMLAAGPHSEALAASAPSITAEPGAAEHDVLDTALRPPVRQGHDTLSPLRVPAAAGLPEPEHRLVLVPAPAPASYSPALRSLRCVVLRC